MTDFIFQGLRTSGYRAIIADLRRELETRDAELRDARQDALNLKTALDALRPL